MGRCVLRAVCRYGWVAGSGSADDHPDQRRIAVHRNVLAVHTRWQTRLGGVDGVAARRHGDQAKAIDQSIKALQDAGGDVMISMGGAAGTSLAQYYSAHGKSAQQLADAYADDRHLRVTHIDFDIEGAAVADPASNALNSQALKLLQQTKPEVQVWYTLPVLPTGLTADGLNVVKSTLDAGVNLAGVNIMAMDYGEYAALTSGPSAKTMGAYAIDSAGPPTPSCPRSTADTARTFDYSQLGVTP